MRESDIERYAIQRVAEAGGEVRKVQWVGRRGAPDRLVMLPARPDTQSEAARTVWVEFKAPGKNPEAHQIAEHEALRRLGQIVIVIDSVEQVDALVR